MAKNVEIKARLDKIEIQRSLAASLSDSPVTIIEQEDVFFRTLRGRLKLRLFHEGHGELIFYSRENRTGPKLSQYHIYTTDNPTSLRAILSNSLGVRGMVRKRRELYLHGRTRIHLDSVAGLGDFMELEVVLSEHDDLRAGEKEADELMKKLKVGKDQLVADAYIDLLEKCHED